MSMVVDLLDIEDGVARVHGGLVLGGLADQTLLLVEGDERRGGEAALLVGNDLDIVSLVDGDAGVGGTCRSKAQRPSALVRAAPAARKTRRDDDVAPLSQHTQINADGTVVDFFGHRCVCSGEMRSGRGMPEDGSFRGTGRDSASNLLLFVQIPPALWGVCTKKNSASPPIGER